MYCSKCGAACAEGTLFCGACGNPLSGPPGEPQPQRGQSGSARGTGAAQSPAFFVPPVKQDPPAQPNAQQPPVSWTPPVVTDAPQEQAPQPPADTAPENDGGTAAKKRKVSPVVPIMVVLLLVLGIAGALIAMMSNSEFSDGWFTRANAKKSEPVSVLDAVEKTVFNTDSCDFRCDLEGGDAAGTVEWGEDVLHSRIAIEVNDQVIYLNEGRLIIAEGNTVSGIDLNDLFDVLDSSADVVISGLNLYEKLGLTDFYDPDWMSSLREASTELKQLPERLVEEERLNQDYLTELFNKLIDGFVSSRIGEEDPTREDGAADGTGTQPDFQWLIDMVTDFLMNCMSESAVRVQQEGSGKNATYHFHINVSVLTDEVIDYFGKTELVSSVCRLFGVTVNDLIRALELDDILADFKAMFSGPIDLTAEISKGLLAGCKVTAQGETLADLRITGYNSAKVNTEDYAYVEAMLSDPTVENRFISNVRAYLFGGLFSSAFGN